MTMSPEDTEDKRSVIFMGQIPLGKEDEYRYPTEFELEIFKSIVKDITNIKE